MRHSNICLQAYWHPSVVIPVSGFHLCRFLCAAYHYFLARVCFLFPRCAGRGNALWILLVDLEALDGVGLMMPWLMTCPDIDRCWPWRLRHDAVHRTAGLPQSSDAPFPWVALQSSLYRSSSVVQAILLDVASHTATSTTSRTLRWMAEPAPTEPEDLFHIKLLLPWHRHPLLGLETQAVVCWVPKNMESKEEKSLAFSLHWLQCASSVPLRSHYYHDYLLLFVKHHRWSF